MEESKELKRLYNIMQVAIYVVLLVEIFVFILFHFSSKLSPILGRIATIPIYNNIFIANYLFSS